MNKYKQRKSNLYQPWRRLPFKISQIKIDQLIYKLYGLTPEEVKIVEGNL